MQSVLSIDTSCNPAAAVVVQVDGRQAVVQEIHRFSFADGFTLNGHSQTDETIVAPTGSSASGAAHPISQGDIETLKGVIASIKTPWTSSILIIPPHDYLSLNLDLPFLTTKGLDKIVDLEVQDLLPFDLDEFLLHYRMLEARSDNNRDIHVGLLPRGVVGKALELCKGAGLEPYMVSTPSGVLEAISFLSSEQVPNACAVLLNREPFFFLSILVGGRACMDRVIDRRKLSDSNPETLARELRLTLAMAEQRYGQKIEKMFTLGTPASTELQELLPLPISNVSVPELVRAADASTAVACFASVFAQDFSPPPILSNFRIKEFAYSPQLRELIRGLRSLLPYFLGFLLAAVLAAIGVYSLRERRIYAMRNAVHDQIRTAIPSLEVEKGLEIDALDGQNLRLEQQLANLGPLSALSPLDYISEISSDLPLASGIAVTRVKVEGNKMRVDGSAPDYAAMDKIEKILKRKKNVYCRVRKDMTQVSGKPNLRGFVLDIVLCE
jgi:hypothetical protein